MNAAHVSAALGRSARYSGLVFALCVTVAAFAEVTPQMERQPLFAPDGAKAWSAAECTVEMSTAHVKSTPSALRWHIPVDYFAGEKDYPIGWPRINRAFPAGPLRDWSGWDFLHIWMYTETSRAELPREAAGLALYTPDSQSGYHRALKELKKGEWVEFMIPLTEVPRHNDVRAAQFHISESNYKHQDTVDFYIAEFELLRYARPTLLDFTAERTALYADTGSVPVRFQLSGVKPDERLDVSLELRRESETIARTAVKAGRGTHRALLGTGGGLKPGIYDLAARLADGTELKAPQLRLVESPWK